MSSNKSHKKNFSVRPFEKLNKKIAKTENIPLPSTLLPKKKEHFTDEELFSTAMSQVQEIKKFRELSFTQ